MAPDRVLTASHCVWRRNVSLLNPVLVGGVERRVVRFAMHPKWRLRNGANRLDDVAILQLNEPVAGVQPLALGGGASGPLRVLGRGVDRPSDEIVGIGDVLRQAFLRPISDLACARALRGHRGRAGERFDAARMRCAIDVDGRRPLSSFCQGDGGGPLLDAAAPVPTLVGVASWTTRCGADHRPDVFADISHYRDFVANPNPAWAPATQSLPTIDGTPAVGVTLSCLPPPWDVEPTNWSVTWDLLTGPDSVFDPVPLADKIVGRRVFYTVKSSDRGGSLNCRIRASNKGGEIRIPSQRVLIPR